MLNSSSSCDLTGTPRAEATLAACINGGRLSHAILVEGHEATLTFAKKIAKSVLCTTENSRPCGLCRDCRKSEKDAHPDLLVYSGGDKARSFHIDAVRELKQEAYIKPNEADGRVFILENVQNMTIQAQNALLKIIEEPPANVTFILTCENKSTLLETVLSRVSVFSLDETFETEPNDTELAGKAAATLKELLSGSELNVLAAFAPYERDRAGFAGFLAALRKEAVKNLLSGAKSGDLSGRDKLFKIIAIIDDLERALSQNAGGLLLTVMLSVKLKSR